MDIHGHISTKLSVDMTPAWIMTLSVVVASTTCLSEEDIIFMWIKCLSEGHAQARNRRGAVGPSPTNTSSLHEKDGSIDIKSPLLTQSEAREDSKPLPASLLPSQYSYGDDDDGDSDEEPHGTISHKGVRWRIWQRRGFAESELGRKKSSKTHEEEGKHAWSAGVMQERGAYVGRAFSLWVCGGEGRR
jgi:hypothetical protein